MSKLRILCFYKNRFEANLRYKLLSKYGSDYIKLLRCYSTSSAKKESHLRDNIEDNSDSSELKDRFLENVIFHSFYKYENFVLQKKTEFFNKVIKQKEINKEKLVPVSLKYILGREDNNEKYEKNSDDKADDNVVLPYEISKVNVPVVEEVFSVEDSDTNHDESSSNDSAKTSIDELVVDRKFLIFK